jgi:hypothetical protein
MPLWTHYIGTSIDSFLICCAWGALRSRKSWLRLALLFGLFDAAATWAAAHGASGVLAYAAISGVLWVTARVRRPERSELVMLPALLGIDNLMLGIAEPSAVTAGLVSSLEALLGFGAAALVLGLVSPRFQGVVSLLLALLCVSTFSLT